MTSEEFKTSVTEHVNSNSPIRSEDHVISYLSCVKYTVCFLFFLFFFAGGNVGVHNCRFRFGSAFSHKYIYGQAGLTKINKMT